MSTRRHDGEGSPRQHGNKWEWHVSLGFEVLPDGTRRRVRRVASGDTFEEARDAGAKLRRDFEQTRINSRSTLREVTEQYFIAHARSINQRGMVRGTTLTGYRYASRHWLAAFGDRRITELRASQITIWLREMVASGYARSSVESYKVALSSVLSWAILHDVLAYNPATAARLPGKRARQVPRALTLAQAQQVIAHSESDPNGPRWIIFLHCGLRRGELVGLQWGDIDWQARTLTVRRQRVFDRAAGGIVEREPKNDASADWLPLSRRAYDALRLWLARQRVVPEASDYVFHKMYHTRHLREPVNPTTIWRHWRALAATLGFDHRLHDLRHTTATLLYRDGEQDKNVQRVMRHASPETTRATYIHTDDDDLRAAMERLDNVYAGGGGKSGSSGSSLAHADALK